MTYKNLKQVISDLENHGHLKRITKVVDPYLEMADIQLEAYANKDKALYFENVKGSPFPAVSNIFGTNERVDFLFRKTMPKVKKVFDLKVKPDLFIKKPLHYLSAPFTALNALPRRTFFKTKFQKTTIDKLPQIVSWKDDGGAFITLPQVVSFPPGSKKIMKSNIGMYRVQLSGNQYIKNKEIGLHYQIHRGIGIHHKLYNQSDEDFRVSIFIGGPPAHTFSSIMPLPEGLSETTFAGLLNGRAFRYFWQDGYLMSNDADFIITGKINKKILKPEGPFGDHIGYYSLEHDFPFMEVENVYHRPGAIWNFTVVGRPPQEDSGFGYLIHKIVANLSKQEFPGVKSIHAVDAAGVHPLLLAVGSERYMPFREEKPEEIITQGMRILGSGQTSLAKFLWIAADNDHKLDANDTPTFFDFFLSRVNWERDLHFITNTTIDTLDYSGHGWNAGSKVLISAYGSPLRKLRTKLDVNFSLLHKYVVVRKGVLAIELEKHTNYEAARNTIDTLIYALRFQDLSGFPLVVVVDDADFTAASDNNFFWVTFTRADPARDLYGVDEFVLNKHWGCKGSLIIDARVKGHHAPGLER